MAFQHERSGNYIRLIWELYVNHRGMTREFNVNAWELCGNYKSTIVKRTLALF